MRCQVQPQRDSEMSRDLPLQTPNSLTKTSSSTAPGTGDAQPSSLFAARSPCAADSAAARGVCDSCPPLPPPPADQCGPRRCASFSASPRARCVVGRSHESPSPSRVPRRRNPRAHALELCCPLPPAPSPSTLYRSCMAPSCVPTHGRAGAPSSCRCPCVGVWVVVVHCQPGARLTTLPLASAHRASCMCSAPP
jgi:hypothetical protein